MDLALALRTDACVSQAVWAILEAHPNANPRAQGEAVIACLVGSTDTFGEKYASLATLPSTFVGNTCAEHVSRVKAMAASTAPGPTFCLNMQVDPECSCCGEADLELDSSALVRQPRPRRGLGCLTSALSAEHCTRTINRTFLAK